MNLTSATVAPFRQFLKSTIPCGLLIVIAFAGEASPQTNATLTKRLAQQPISSLMQAVYDKGDPKRGAVFFHQQATQCHQCHQGNGNHSLGPDLTKSLSDDFDAQHLVQSILYPSQSIRKGFETTVVTFDDGRTVTGILESESDTHLILFDAADAGHRRKIAKDSIEERTRVAASIMPAGLVDQLSGEQDFYDLASYVLEVARHGESRARELQPAADLLVAPALPDYESRIDHAALIQDLDEDAFARGELIYERVCANCHGTHDRIGSLPTAPQFAKGTVKRGTQPWTMYQTLTHGYGMMVAQHWMVPRQKYDVIHYIREEFFREDAKDRYFPVTEEYLASLPKGTLRGPAPRDLQPYVMMDYGRFLMNTYEMVANTTGKNVGNNLGRSPNPNRPRADPDPVFSKDSQPNFAYKGIAIQLDNAAGGVSRGSQWMVYDHDTMNLQGAWSGEKFIDYCAIQFDGRHATHARLGSPLNVTNEIGPGWKHPQSGSATDPRPTGRDGRYYGPLPKRWLAYRGLYDAGERIVLSYSVGDAEVLESPRTIPTDGECIFVRDFWIENQNPLSVRICPDDGFAVTKTVPPRAEGETPRIVSQGGSLWCEIPANSEPMQLSIAFSGIPIAEDIQFTTADLQSLIAPANLTNRRWQDIVETSIERSVTDSFVVDHMTVPEVNPWNCRVRCTGHDFVDEDTAAVCTWDGDVWLVSGILGASSEGSALRWRRIASGLFQPLGLKIVNGEIYVACRDQITILHDLNADGQTDFYECFNNDHQVTEHFHEFAMGLQTDAAGNFYYAKSARHAKRAVVPHHGTLLRVSSTGDKTDIIATGFRAANGVCLNPDGTFFVTDQEGHWNPKNRINWVQPNEFYGNMYGYTDVTDDSDAAMQPPLCWITNAFDRSPAELLWVPEHSWGRLGGSLLNLSYGYGRAYIVPHENKNGILQGGMCRLPIPDFPSGLVRGRFHPNGHDLFLCSMFVWSSNQQEPGGFHRVRYRGDGAHLPTQLAVHGKTISFTLSDPVDPVTSTETERYEVQSWDIRRSAHYGSQHYNERRLAVSNVELTRDGRTVRLTIPDLKPTWCMSIEMQLKDPSGKSFSREIHNTIHKL